jgi:hypothetical protein
VQFTHQSGPFLLSDSVFFLLNYYASCSQAKLEETVSRKGKEHCSGSDNKGEMRSMAKWKPPLEGWTKINMDGSFVEHTGQAGIGIIAKESSG